MTKITFKLILIQKVHNTGLVAHDLSYVSVLSNIWFIPLSLIKITDRDHFVRDHQ